MRNSAQDYRNMTAGEIDSIVMREFFMAATPTHAEYDFTPCPLDDVTAVMSSFRCLKLVRQTVETFRKFYPDMPMIIVDDTGQFGPDPATDYIKGLPVMYGNVTAVIHTVNLTHGPSLHEGILAAKSRLVLTLDSDLVIKRGGWVEAMKRGLDARGLLAIGPIYDSAYIATALTLWDRAKYMDSPGLIRHSMPAIVMMQWFYDNPDKFKAENFPMWEDYVTHIGAGTRNMYASQRGWWDPSSPGAQDIWVGRQPERPQYPELQ